MEPHGDRHGTPAPINTQTSLHVAGFVFLALLGLALARITVPITNLVLDPSEETSPFRPHPGRRNLAPALVAVLIAGTLANLSQEAIGFLAIAAGAAFLDRVGEAFVGREALRTELAALAGSSALSGIGLLLCGAALLGAPFAVSSGLHVAFLGGLGLGVLAVLAIAGLLHCGRPLRLDRLTKIGFVCLLAGTFVRAPPPLRRNSRYPVLLMGLRPFCMVPPSPHGSVLIGRSCPTHARSVRVSAEGVCVATIPA